MRGHERDLIVTNGNSGSLNGPEFNVFGPLRLVGVCGDSPCSRRTPQGLEEGLGSVRGYIGGRGGLLS